MRHISAVVLMALSGCSSLTTQSGAGPGDGDGLVYYMPNRDFVVTITKASGKFTGLTLGTTPAYADYSKSYVLQYDRNLVAKNKLDVEISPAGLLTIGKSTTTGDVVDVFKHLGASAGVLGALRSRLQVPVKPVGVTCDSDGTHTFVLSSVTSSSDICGNQFNVRISRLWSEKDRSRVATGKGDGFAHSGLFYRMNLPYLMEATGQGLNAATVVLSPSESKILFLPIARTLFSTNDAQVSLADGVPTKYVQETDGELISLLKLPAAIIGGYFEAIGAVFGKFSATDTVEAKALIDALKLELAKQKYEACLVAIRAKDDKAIDDLKCISS